MNKSIVVCGMFFYSAWALQEPDSGAGTLNAVDDVKLFKEQVRELQRFAFKVRGRLLGNDLSLVEGFVGRVPMPWHLLHEVVPTHVDSVDLAEIVNSLATYISDARALFQQAQTHQKWLLLSEYRALIETTEHLKMLHCAAVLKQQRVRGSASPINPFK